MSCDTQRLLNNTEHFKLLCSLKYEDVIPFSMYRSEITGITVCIAEVDGPFIDGDFNIATETCDNDGLPYVMEHLIFTGTKDYPYDNILKLWALKSLASNITVYTSQTRTCFTMKAAGSEGFLNLMPLYLDHILFPSLKNSTYLTEVHHITDKGKNGGVVYCKTQIEENTADYIINKRMLQMLYPENCGYNSIILGTTKNLRESTNNEKVKQFHRKFYRPENLTILITGKIQPDAIFQALLPLEKKIMSKERKDIFERPWQTPVRPLKKSVDVELCFPSGKEEYGEVHVAWRGPSTITHLCDYRGCLLLLCYLISSDSPLTKEFSEIDDNSFITWNTSQWSDPYLKIIFKNVPVEQIDLITIKSIRKVLRNLCTDGINMETIKTLSQKLSFDYRSDMENNPHESISVLLFDHLIYDNTDNLNDQLNFLREMEKLKNKSENYFSTLLKKYFVDAPMVFVKGRPSIAMYLKLQGEETNITKKNKTGLSRKCLKQKEKELQDAINKKNKNVPDKDLCKVPMPDIDSITFHHIERYNTETVKQHPKFDVKKLPFFTYLDDVDTNFFYLQIIMDTSCIRPQYKPYIPLLTEVITESPIIRANQLISCEKVKDLLFADNIQVQSHLGINTSGHIPHSMSLMIKADLHNYEKSVQWCKELLYDTILTTNSLHLKAMIIKVLLNRNIIQGETLLGILMTTLLYTDDNNRFRYNVFRQHKFHTYIQNLFETYVGQKKMMAEVESVRQTLTSPKNMFLYMAVNVNKLTQQVPDVFAPWNKFFSNFMNLEKTKVNVISNSKLLTPSNSVTYNGFIIKLEWMDFSYLIQTCPCINDLQHPDLPALEVCLTYFRQEEGPIWKEIEERQMFSDKFNLYTTVDTGYLNLQFTRFTNVVAAYKKTQSILKTHLAKPKWDKYIYEKAKSSVMLNYINNVQTIRHVMNASLMSYCKTLPHDYNSEMVRRVSAVTIDDMNRVTKQYIKPLFDLKQCKIAIVCNNDKFAEIENAFKKMKFNFNVFKSIVELSNYIENGI